MSKWELNGAALIIGLLCLLIGTVFYFVVSSELAKPHEKRLFMAQCLKDHKQYECDVMWGQAQ